MEKGKVKWFNDKKGYGFIVLDSGEEVFVHHSAIDSDGHRTLQEGQDVECEVEDGQKGKQAKKVIKI